MGITSTIVTATTIRWAVKPIAIRRGIPDAKTLALLADLDAQTITAVWDGRYQKGKRNYSLQVHVETIRKLCLALDAQPPGALKWVENGDSSILAWHRKVQGEPPYLVWRVAELAKAKGYDRISFARAAQMLYSRMPKSTPMPADRLWAGQYRAIAISTLATISDVLGVELGDLFSTSPPYEEEPSNNAETQNDTTRTVEKREPDEGVHPNPPTE